MEVHESGDKAVAPPDDDRLRLLIQGLLLVAAYFVAAKLGLGYATIATSVTLLWPPSGIALFALLVFGVRLWPVVFLGALAANMTTGIPIGASIGIAVGNCLEAVAGYYLLCATGFQVRLQRCRDVVMLVSLAAGVSTMIGASIGSLSLAAFNIIPWDQFGRTWAIWWMGDAMGDLVFAPALLAWWGMSVTSARPRRIAEAALLAMCLAGGTEVILGETFLNAEQPWPLAFMTFPLLTWAALRFGMRGATGATLIVGAVTLANVISGQGLFARQSPLESLILLWLYTNVAAITGMVLAATVVERLRAEERMRYLAQHDALTGLPNRVTLQAEIHQAMGRARRHNQLLAVIFVDIDRFKVINDTLGHSIGDKLLGQIGTRLHACVRQGDILTRHGGDEFIILLEDIKDREAVSKVARKVLDGLHLPFMIEGTPLYVTASIGISFFPNDGRDVDSLLKNADVAMYRAKDLGRNNYVYYAAEMNARAGERLAMENELRSALDRGEFLLHYQPQYDVTSGQVVGAEALLRWRRPDGELVPLDSFVPLLEETGLINLVGVWVLDTACVQLADWHARGAPHLRMAVNVSSHQLRDGAFPQQVTIALAQRNLSARFLELEITESMLVRQDAVVERNIEQLVGLGARLAVDDFGTGYSSLSYLHQLSIDTLKIDRAFVTNIPREENCVAIARAIVGLGKSLHLTLIAEGVEMPAQREFLHQLGCDTMQGFLFSPPVTASEFARLIEPGGPPVRQAS